MKDDTISRQAAIDSAVEAADEWDGGYSRSREEIITMKLRMLPSVQPRIGHWIEDNEGYFYCDKCGKYPAYQITQTNYCPNCGSYNGGKN